MLIECHDRGRGCCLRRASSISLGLKITRSRLKFQTLHLVLAAKQASNVLYLKEKRWFPTPLKLKRIFVYGVIAVQMLHPNPKNLICNSTEEVKLKNHEVACLTVVFHESQSISNARMQRHSWLFFSLYEKHDKKKSRLTGRTQSSVFFLLAQKSNPAFSKINVESRNNSTH